MRMQPLNIDLHLAPTSNIRGEMNVSSAGNHSHSSTTSHAEKSSAKARRKPYEEVPTSEVYFPSLNNLRHLGRGSYGTVVECLFRGRLAAAKLVETNTDYAYLHMQNEAILLSDFNHENIIQLYAVFNGEPSGLLLELMEGGSMTELLHQNKHISYQACHILGWALQTSSALSYLHERGYVHRDLKPSNLLLSYDYFNLKLCDFGTAADLRTTMTNYRGSAAYMAPEVFKGRQYNQKCDIYSFGIVLWELIARRIPFNDRDPIPLSVLWQASSGRRPEPIIDCPEPISDLMQRCWIDDPVERPYIGEVSATIEILCEIYPNRFIPLIDSSTGRPTMAPRRMVTTVYRQQQQPDSSPALVPTSAFHRSPSTPQPIPPPVPPPPKFIGQHRRGASSGSANILIPPIGHQRSVSNNSEASTPSASLYAPNTTTIHGAATTPQFPTSGTSTSSPMPYSPCLVNSGPQGQSVVGTSCLPPPPAAFNTQLSGPQLGGHFCPPVAAVRQESTRSKSPTSFQHASTSALGEEVREAERHRTHKKRHGLMKLLNGIKKEFTHGH